MSGISWGQYNISKQVLDELGNTAKKTDITNLQNHVNTRLDNLDTSINTKLNNLKSNVDNSFTDIKNEMNNLKTIINNQLENLIAPTLSKVSGYNNATATTTGSFRVVLDYSNATEFRYKVGSGSWSEWMSLSLHDAQGYFNASGLSNGASTIYVEIRNSEESPVAKGRISVFRVN